MQIETDLEQTSSAQVERGSSCWASPWRRSVPWQPRWHRLPAASRLSAPSVSSASSFEYTPATIRVNRGDIVTLEIEVDGRRAWHRHRRL